MIDPLANAVCLNLARINLEIVDRDGNNSCNSTPPRTTAPEKREEAPPPLLAVNVNVNVGAN